MMNSSVSYQHKVLFGEPCADKGSVKSLSKRGK
jgi:hypothetical protein